MKRTISLAAVLLVLAAAAPLSGQSHRSFREEYESIRSLSKVRLGPVRLVPVFRLSDAGYDSNVYFREQGSEAVGDATATLSPELRGYGLLGGSIILSATENPEYLAFAREKSLRAFTNSVSAGLRWLLLRHFSLSAEYHALNHVRRSLSEFDRRIRDTATGAKGALFFETARGTAFGFAGSLDDFRYKDVASGTADDVYGRMLDRREASAAVELYYRVFSASCLFATVGGTRYDFRHPESAWRDGSSFQAWGGFRFPLAGRARGAVRITDVVFRLGRLGVTLGLDRDNAFSYNESAFYYVDTRARAGLSLYLAEFLRIDGGVQYGTMSYPEPQEIWWDGVLILVDRREDIQRNFSVGPVVRLGGTVGLGLTYNFYKRTSNAPGFDVRRNFVGAFITYEF
jgi:hypothetical protein